MSPLLVFSGVVMLGFAVWSVIVWLRWQPETEADKAGWYESGLGKMGNGTGYN